MKLPPLLLFIPLFLIPAPARAQEPADLEEMDDFQAALRALEDDLPSVAAQKLQRLYRDTRASLPESGRRLLTRTFFESLFATERFERMLHYAEQPFFADQPGTKFWKGVALGRTEKPAEAVALLRPIAGDESHRYREAAALAGSRLLLRLDRPEAAIEMLQPLFRSQVKPRLQALAMIRAAEIHLARDRPEEAKALLGLIPDEPGPELASELVYVRAKIALAEKRFEEAAKVASQLMKDTLHRHLSLHNRSLLLRADALLAQERQEDAVSLLQQFVSEQPNASLLPLAFQRLDEAGFFSSRQIALKSWLRSSSPRVRALTQFYICDWAETDPEHIAHLETFLREFPDHELQAPARLKLALIQVSRAPEESARLLAPLKDLELSPAMRQAIADVAARAQFALGNYSAAADSFRQTGRSLQDLNHIFNAAVSAIYADDPRHFQEDLQYLALDETTRDTRIELELERGLYLAAQNHPNAIRLLKQFTREHPDHPRVEEAEIAIAELYLLVGFPIQSDRARRQLESLTSRELPPSHQEQVDYITFWIEAIDGNRAQAVRLGRRFLQTWPDSTRRGDVLMKIGEMHYAARDFAQAQSAFDELVQEDPKGPYSEAALFFSAKSAIYSMNQQDREEAIRKWRIVIDRGGALANEARHQQSLAKLREGKPREALAVIEALLDRRNRISPELRMAALITRGQALMDLVKRSEDPDGMLIAAIATFDQIIEDRYANRFWVNQAALLKGKCLEGLGDDDKALEVYYDVVNRSPLSNLNGREAPEYTWYYRAGFAAIEILRNRKQWRSAVRLAERLGDTSGPRAGEAAELANRLRLLHFIWDDESAPESVDASRTTAP